MIHLSTADYRTQPWANGRGTTTEILLETASDGRVLLRLSMAVVSEDGPFSVFPGIARNLTVLTGPGFGLRGAGLLLQARPLHPIAFPGDLAVCAEGVTAPSTDFNVMTAAHLPRPQVWLAEPGAAIAAQALIFALGATTLHSRTEGLALQTHDLLIMGQPTTADQPVLCILRS